MPRYPGLVKSRINIDGAMIGAGLAAGEGAELIKPDSNEINSSAEAETLETRGDSTGGVPVNRTPQSNYPMYQSPSRWKRFFDPAGAARIEGYNQQALFQQAADQTDLNRIKAAADAQASGQIKVKDYDYMMQSARKVLERRGFDPATIDSIIHETGQHAALEAESNRRLEEQKALMLKEEPEVGYLYHKATLRQPIVANANVEAQTTGRLIDNETAGARNLLNLDLGRQNLKDAQQQYGIVEQGIPYRQQILKNQSIQSGIIPFEPGKLYFNVPTGEGGQPYNALQVAPAVPFQRSESQLITDPETGKTTGIRQLPSVPAQPPYATWSQSASQLRNPVRPIQGNMSGSATDESLYETRINPVTGQKERRLRNP